MLPLLLTLIALIMLFCEVTADFHSKLTFSRPVDVDSSISDIDLHPIILEHPTRFISDNNDAQYQLGGLKIIPITNLTNQHINHGQKRLSGFSGEISTLVFISAELSEQLIISSCQKLRLWYNRPWFFVYSHKTDELAKIEVFSGKWKLVDKIDNVFEWPNLFGNKIKVAAPPQATVHFFNAKDPSNTYMGEILNAVGDILNVTFDYYWPTDGGNIGLSDEKGNYNGIMGMLQQGNVDFGIGDISFDEKRSAVANPSVALYYEVVGPMYAAKATGKDSMYSKYWLSFVYVFDPWMWVVVVAMIFVLATALTVIYVFHGKTIFQVIFVAFIMASKSFVCFDNGLQRQRYISLNICIYVGTLCGCIVFWTYNGCLISYFTAPSKEPPFSSWEELAQMPPDYKLFMTRDITKEFFMRDLAKNMSYAKMNENRLEFVNNHTEGLKKTKQGLGTYVRVLDLFPEEESCNVKWNGQLIYPTLAGWYYNKKFGLQPEIDQALLKVVQSGLFKRMSEKYGLVELSKVVCPEEKISEAATFASVASLFVLLGSGAIVSFIVVVIEILVKKRNGSLITDIQCSPSEMPTKAI